MGLREPPGKDLEPPLPQASERHNQGVCRACGPPSFSLQAAPRGSVPFTVQVNTTVAEIHKYSISYFECQSLLRMVFLLLFVCCSDLKFFSSVSLDPPSYLRLPLLYFSAQQLLNFLSTLNLSNQSLSIHHTILVCLITQQLFKPKGPMLIVQCNIFAMRRFSICGHLEYLTV